MTVQLLAKAQNGFGASINDRRTLIAQLRKGFAYHQMTRLQSRSGLTIHEIAQFIQVPLRTLARRKASGRMTPTESERLWRLLRLFESTVQLFEGDADAAREWLMNPNRALGREKPISLAETEVGAREVEDLLGRLEHGVFS